MPENFSGVQSNRPNENDPKETNALWQVNAALREAGIFREIGGANSASRGLGFCVIGSWVLPGFRRENPPMLPKLNRRRAQFVLTKIDEISAWEQRKEAEKDTRFVELGRYLSEVRAGQYWRLENLKSFDEFLEKRFPESRRKAYYGLLAF
jgi:hypothetical protein